MTSGTADPNSLSSYAMPNWPLASLTETRGAEITGADRGSRQLSGEQSAAAQGDRRTRLRPGRLGITIR